MRFSFIPYGSFVIPEPKIIVLDVGNQLCKGVIDHHQPGAEKECSTSLIFRYPHYILDHVKGIPLEEITLITHISPDLDAVTSSFFCHSILLSGLFPPFAEKIAAYVRDVDMGICFRRPNTVVTVYSIFTALCELIRKEGEKKNWPPEKVYMVRIEYGFSLWEYVISLMDNSTDLHDSSIFESRHPFQEAHDLVKKDYSVYLQDLRKSKKTKFTIPNKSGIGSGEVDGLMAVNPQSLLFRSWARGDNLNSAGGRGFTMLAINYHHKRYIISVDPQSPYYLKGLGDLLEKFETKKRKELGKERLGKTRPGYTSPDPWYDGRNPLHNYTIVDTPKNGTVLTWEEIQEIIAKYDKMYYRTTQSLKT